MDLLQAWVEKGTDFLMSFLLIVILVGTGIDIRIVSDLYRYGGSDRAAVWFLEISV